MPHGKASRKRNWQQSTKAKATARKAEKRAAEQPTMESRPRQLIIPTITEDHLLSFQFAHFGDDTKPDSFFVDPEQALNYRPDFEDLGDDGLGWYDDGVKRTLTDEQIEMFRHTEIEQLLRQRRLEAEEDEEEAEDEDDDFYEPTDEPEVFQAYAPEPQSPVSDASSLEPELFTKAVPQQKNRQLKSKPQPRKPSVQSNRSESAQPGGARSPRSRQRKSEVPYDQRNKRKWESFIDGEDPVHGSMTHRRMVRELDSLKGDSVAMDYGDDEPAPLKPAPLPAMPGRRIVSYEDD